jgi:homoserine acetyltransferase
MTPMKITPGPSRGSASTENAVCRSTTLVGLQCPGEGKVAVVTVASRGIGRAIAIRLGASKEAPTREAADRVLDEFVARTVKSSDANDVLYALESSTGYDPGAVLGRIMAPLLAINFKDDLINPPELGVLEREVRRVKRGKALVIPGSDRTRGHGTHTLAVVWKEHLIALLGESGR